MESDPHSPESSGSDSLDMIEILMAYEEAFGEEIPDPEIQKIGEFRTRQELIDYLRSRRKGGDLN